MKKIDFKKELSNLYRSSKSNVEFVNVPAMNFLMIDGQGDPNTSEAYSAAVEALFSVSYTLKFTIKKSAMAIDYGVMPLEGLWWVEDMSEFDPAHKENWLWTAMIMQPPLIEKEQVLKAMEDVKQKKNLKALSKIRFSTFEEGPSAQIMHIGPFSEEGPAIEKVHNYIKSNGFQLRGKHHEIYLSDIRRAAPEKWKTIIRQPYA